MNNIIMLIIGVQATRHMVSFIYWITKKIINEIYKIIVFVFSPLFISNVHNMGMLCQNLFVIYLNPKQEKEISSKCNSSQWLDNDYNTCENVAIMGMTVVWIVVMVSTILIEWHVLKISWLDVVRLVLFLLAPIMQAF